MPRDLGVPNYHDLLPRTYSWWLKRRYQIREVTLTAKAVSATPDAN